MIYFPPRYTLLHPAKIATSFDSSIRSYRHVFDQFLSNCLAYKKRPKLRVIIDSIIWLLTPAVISSFLYIKVIIVLCSRKRNATRNTTLSISFAISWILWLVCWMPNYISLILWNDSKKVTSMLMVYLIFFRTPLQMTYSQFNPVIFIIVMKPFQIFAKKFARLLFFSAQENKNGIAFSADASPRKLLFKFVYGVIFVLLTALVVIQASGASLNVCKTSALAQTQLFHVRKEVFISVQKVIQMNYAELLTSAVDPRNACGFYHGTFTFSFRRCYFVQEHEGIGLNFTEQVNSCSKVGAVLFYARSKREIDFVWDSVYKPFRSEPYQNSLFITGDWFLHMGFVLSSQQRNISNVFTSIDGTFDISYDSHYWFYLTGQYVAFSGPSVCLLEPYLYTFNRTRLYQCLPRMRAKFSVCFIDYVDSERSIDLM